MTTIVFAPDAQKDLLEIQSYIKVNLSSPDAAQNTMKAIIERTKTLQTSPEQGTILQVNVTRTDYRFVTANNYIIFYRYEKSTVFIIRILYCKQNYLNILFGPNDEKPL